MWRQHELLTLRNEVTMKRVVTCARWETVFRVPLVVGERGVTFALTQQQDLEDAQLTIQDHMFQESGRLQMIQSIVPRKARYFLVAHYQTYTPEELSREHEAAELSNLTLVVRAIRSRWRVTSLATKTSLMNLRIILHEVSGSLHIRWPARRQLNWGDQWREGQRMGKNQRFQSDICCRRRSVEHFSR